MNATKAIYWIALAAFSLALNSEYRQGKFPAAHSLAGRAESTLCNLSTRVEQTLATARFLTGRSALPSDDLLAAATEMAGNRADLREQVRDKAELIRDQVRAQADIIRAQREIQRAQIERIRARAHSQLALSLEAGRDACPKSAEGIALNSARGSFVDDIDDEEDSLATR